MKWYELIFKQIQPIHIGSIKWGVINETEIFIPGWTMWGALTNQYLRAKRFNEIDKAKRIFEHITNFYPCIKYERDECLNKEPLFPKYKEGNFYIGDYFEDEFKFDFVDTIVSTAIEPLSRKAKDESIHEFEFILPVSKQNRDKPKQLYWIGLVGLEDDMIDNIKSFFKSSLKIYIGGDAKYGFGELKLIEISELNNKDGDVNQELKKWDLDENGYLFLYNEKDNLTLKHFFKFSNMINFEGEIKLLIESDFSQNTPRILNANYFVNIGSKIINRENLRNYQLFKGKLIKTK
ncbi:hypothetical protein [Thermoanaerobacterium sp. R66]|uniref:hypothetical protein n=1 Tax=Thermoanaerobacterium sp. R66 TaxID=2742479 RepID=UPI0023805E0C|nr:hypothetical protein [Thermoanaerobacterium sp. R66]MDE4543262.1 hypothetical protein [Thermoanaerobacterium sp. R66]